jgi:hypothetical protein
LGPPGAAGILASAGTSLLDYKRGVPVAQPHWEGVGGKEKRIIESVNTIKVISSRKVLWNCLV